MAVLRRSMSVGGPIPHSEPATSLPTDTDRRVPAPPLAERVSAAFERLAVSAVQLNTVSDELSQPIASIETSLKPLNLGVSTWHEYVGHIDPQTHEYWERRLGYAKIGNKWGIAIQAREGNFSDDEPRREESWLFTDAPRAFRVEAVDHIPTLLEKLATAADETAATLKSKIETTRAIATAIGRVASSLSGRQK